MQGVVTGHVHILKGGQDLPYVHTQGGLIPLGGLVGFAHAAHEHGPPLQLMSQAQA